jgi:hypothetical protein
MRMVLFLEASQPSGNVYRCGLGVQFPLELVSLVMFLARWF